MSKETELEEQVRKMKKEIQGLQKVVEELVALLKDEFKKPKSS